MFFELLWTFFDAQSPWHGELQCSLAPINGPATPQGSPGQPTQAPSGGARERHSRRSNPISLREPPLLADTQGTLLRRTPAPTFLWSFPVSRSVEFLRVSSTCSHLAERHVIQARLQRVQRAPDALGYLAVQSRLRPALARGGLQQVGDLDGWP